MVNRRRVRSHKIYIGRDKASGLIFAVTNLRLLSENSGMRPGTIKRLFGGSSARTYYEDDRIMITAILTVDIETGKQVPPGKYHVSR